MTAKKTSDALEILHRRYIRGHPEREAELNRERRNAALARKLLALRTGAGMTQSELARQVGTSASVISRLENAGYEGHSLTMLRRVAAALGKDLELKFVPATR